MAWPVRHAKGAPAAVLKKIHISQIVGKKHKEKKVYKMRDIRKMEY